MTPEPAGVQWAQRWQYALYAAIALAALLFFVILLPGSRDYFRRFLGEMQPIVVLLVAAVSGAAALWWLHYGYGFALFNRATIGRGLILAFGLASLIAVEVVIADFFVRYPEDTNVPLPQALLFYPAIGFVAEIVFHLLPLAMILLLLRPAGPYLGTERVVWLAVLLVAVAEPTFQILFDRSPLSWADLYTWLHVFLIACVQLYLLRRFDFITMYGFRLIYYSYWHILWGALRLKLLF